MHHVTFIVLNYLFTQDAESKAEDGRFTNVQCPELGSSCPWTGSRLVKGYAPQRADLRRPRLTRHNLPAWGPTQVEDWWCGVVEWRKSASASPSWTSSLCGEPGHFE